jgi:hypothetical protein
MRIVLYWIGWLLKIYLFTLAYLLLNNLWYLNLLRLLLLLQLLCIKGGHIRQAHLLWEVVIYSIVIVIILLVLLTKLSGRERISFISGKWVFLKFQLFQRIITAFWWSSCGGFQHGRLGGCFFIFKSYYFIITKLCRFLFAYNMIYTRLIDTCYDYRFILRFLDDLFELFR